MNFSLKHCLNYDAHPIAAAQNIRHPCPYLTPVIMLTSAGFSIAAAGAAAPVTGARLDLPRLLQRWNIQNPEQLAARASEHLPFWVSLGLVIAIGYYLARLVWLLVPLAPQAAWSPPPPSAARALTTTGGTAADYAAIASAHLFGQPPANTEPAAGADGADAPETQLNLQLRGAIAADDAQYAHAIIADGNGNEKVYFLKDTLPGGATVHRVQPDRVILNRGGVLEALMLPRDAADSATGAAQLTPAGVRNPAAARRAATRSVQDVVGQNPAGITEIIRPQPYMPSGELKGYRVYPGRNREQFVALGLQPGDLVTEINGMALNNPAQAMEIFRSMADTTQVTVTIEREGQAQSLTLDTGQLAAAGGETE
jgi:general secretion pathway protein C